MLGTRGGQHRTGGCPQKNFPAAFGGRKIFSPAPPLGGENFFPVGCLFSRPGGDFAKKMEKMASPGGQKFFSGVLRTPGHSALSCYWRVMKSL